MDSRNSTETARALSLLRPVRSVTCAVCGSSFTARDARAKTCSARCRQQLRRQRLAVSSSKEQSADRRTSQDAQSDPLGLSELPQS